MEAYPFYAGAKMKEVLITALTLLGMLIGYLCYDSLMRDVSPELSPAATSVEE